ncbi:MAG: Fis family transcriptional regulator [Deltaproteobacteria bacterium]|nr:MAG: Fis family transcriptional regulator [Deltaproteobacteria bacterium]
MEREKPDQPVGGADRYRRQPPLAELVRQWTERLLDQLGDHRLPRLYHRVLEQVEIVLIEQALRRSGGAVGRAADILGIHRNTLRNRMRALGLAGDPRRGSR